MAQRVVVTLFDDIDGSEAAETVAFGLDGKSYEIDLNPANAKQLRKALAPYLQAGRKRNGKAAKADRTDRAAKVFKHTAVNPDPAAVRAWARSNQLDVPPRGRIPKRIYEEFAKAN
ncbi:MULTISPECIES: Lsr2 family protein [unclassified Streptomyces]|uniref:histone-like nucleoid-structuring protein Lsr2 n=1 Tax=unclassified Streptomyces TaxID=2593676 RepID=UPI000DBA6041|nr:Lsr2 family protein [Streptomyces sp. PsTaAH-137]MYT73003.1 Lsr2 family protein [Streptomyces sp. SID8367]RAJ73799.1 Lsr2 protein [Streptomyces sp. PsTaAH-137]